MAHFASKDNDLSTMLPPFWNIQIQGVYLFALFNNKVFLSCSVMISLHGGQCVRHCCAHVSSRNGSFHHNSPCLSTDIWSLCTMFSMKVIIKLTWLADTGNIAGMAREKNPTPKQNKKHVTIPETYHKTYPAVLAAKYFLAYKLHFHPERLNVCGSLHKPNIYLPCCCHLNNGHCKPDCFYSADVEWCIAK